MTQSSTLTFPERRIVQALLEGNHVPENVMTDAIARHAETGGRFVEVLLRNNIIGEKRLADVIAAVSGAKVVDLMNMAPPQDAIDALPAEVAKNLMVMPLGLSGDTLSVAMLNTADNLAIEAVEDEIDLNLEVEVYQGIYSQILWRVATHYPSLGIEPVLPGQMNSHQERLGDYLVRTGKISTRQLEEALVWQSRTERPLGAVLVSEGIISEHDLYQALSEQQGMPFMPDLSTVRPSDDVLSAIPRADALRLGVVPLQAVGNTYEVAVHDPRHFAEIRSVFGEQVRMIISTPLQVDDAVRRLYPLDGKGGPAINMAELQGKNIEDVVLQMGFANQQEIDAARTSGKSLEDTLVQSGKLSPEMLAQSLAAQMGYEFIDPNKSPPDNSVALLIPEHMARQYSVVPVRLQGEALVVAMKDPRNVFALDDLQLIVGRQIIPAVMVEKDIIRLIEKYFGGKDMAVLSQRLLEESRERQKLQEATGAGGEVDDSMDDNAVVRMVENIIREAVMQEVSDIHIEPTETELAVRFRIDGSLRKQNSLPKGSAQALLARIKIMGGLDIAERRQPQDGRVRFRKGAIDIDLRLSTLPTVYGEKAVMRLLQKAENIPEVEQLGFSEHNYRRYLEVIDRPNGIFLVTGPTGSGKSFTSFSTLKRIAKPTKNTTTIEDPVEYEIPGIVQSQVNNAAGMTFAKALRAFLRQDPDIIFVGEIRDSETATIATEAALTGHLVLATLHTNDAAGAIVRLEEMGVELFNIGAAVVGVLAQRLVRRVCKDCAQPTQADPEVLRRLGVTEAEIAGATLMKGAGCPRCAGTGYKGRTGIHELMVIDDNVRRAINSGKTAADIKDVAIEQGEMWTLRKDGIYKAMQGITTLEEVLAITAN